MRGLAIAILCAAIGCAASDDMEQAIDGGTRESPLTRLFEIPYEVQGPTAADYLCKWQTLEEDIIITSFHPVAPLGVHHTILAMDDGVHPDGVDSCQAFAPNWVIMFASGIDSPAMELPQGVGIRVPAGTQMVLQLHLYNADESPLSGTAAMEVTTAEEVEHEAEAVLAGPLTFSLPPSAETKVEGECTLTGDTTLFTIFPHMHALGTHMRVWVDRAGDAELIHDKPYDFEEQLFYSLDEPMPLKAGDKIKVECTFFNPFAEEIHFGDASDEEMCFAISYRYPPLNTSYFCNY